MLKRIFLKDLKRRKSVNIILFLVITLAAVFLSSSVNNILVVTSAVNYYMDYANVPDVSIFTKGMDEKEQIVEWLEEAVGEKGQAGHEKASPVEDGENGCEVEAFGYTTFLSLVNKNITLVQNGQEIEIDDGGSNLHLAAMDSEYCKVFDENNLEFELKPGEISVPQFLMEANRLKPGDTLRIKSDGREKLFTVVHSMKDAAFGNAMMGTNRLVVHKDDYAYMTETGEENLLGLYFVDTSDGERLEKELNSKRLTSVMNFVMSDTYALVYAFDMIMAGLLIAVGLCLILIALLVLRFTLVFTMEEDYREIGIMKAVGLKSFAIQKIYLLKYFALVTSGALLGLGISIPVSRFMVKSVSKNMVLKDSGSDFWVNILCTVLIIVLVMLFNYACTGKINRISAIAAIRGGQTGERFGRGRALKLHTKRRMPVILYLGINDIGSHLRRYMVLMVTFSLSFLLITIPLNTLNTMGSREMAGKFSIDPDSDVYVENIEGEDGTFNSLAKLEESMARVERELSELGYEAELTAVPILFLAFRTADAEEHDGVDDVNSDEGADEGSDGNYNLDDGQQNIMTVQLIGPNNQYWTYSEGKAPVLENEIAFSRKIMEKYGWEIGDWVEADVNGEFKKFLITASYSDYMQLGESARMNPVVDMSAEKMFGCWNINVELARHTRNQTETAQLLNEKLPEYHWSDVQEIIDKNVGGIQQSLKSMLLPMTGMLCGVIMLITMLMEKLFIVREKGEIAMMKSIGFLNRDIRLWQIFRMVGVAFVSMAAAAPLSLASNRFVLKPIFAIMGADVNIQVNPWQVYGVYPAVLWVGIIIAVVLAATGVKRIHIRDMNNLE